MKRVSQMAHSSVRFVLTRTPLGLWPVRVRRGIARGARWTLFPWTSYWRGTHEPALQAALAELGGGDIRGWSCWDIGAHFGLYSIGLALRVGPSGEVAAFEPNPQSFARLERHRRLNRLTWLKTYCAAASDHNEGAELFTYGDLASTTTHLAFNGETRPAASGVLPVRTVRLDDSVRSGELRLPRFVKIDVEGHGHRTLAGMRETLAAARPILIAAFHSDDEVGGMMALLRAQNYRWREIDGAALDPDVRVGRDYLFTPGERAS